MDNFSSYDLPRLSSICQNILSDHVTFSNWFFFNTSASCTVKSRTKSKCSLSPTAEERVLFTLSTERSVSAQALLWQYTSTSECQASFPSWRIHSLLPRNFMTIIGRSPAAPVQTWKIHYCSQRSASGWLIHVFSCFSPGQWFSLVHRRLIYIETLC